MENAWSTWKELARRIRGKEVVFFGVSDDWTKKTIRAVSPDVMCIVDNNDAMVGQVFHSFPVESPDILKRIGRDVYTIITTSSYESVCPQLLEFGLEPGLHFCMTPALNNLRIISDIHSHDASLLISSPDHMIYGGVDNEGASGGGLFLYSIRDRECRRILEGSFRQIVPADSGYYVIDVHRGICELSSELEVVRCFGAEDGDYPHGVAYCEKRGIVFIGRSGLDKISAYSSGTREHLFDIQLSDKFARTGRPQHWINDLCVRGDYIYVCLFSHSGSYLQGMYDGGILQIDLDCLDKRYVIVRDAWMPHSVSFFDGDVCFLDSMRGLFYRTTTDVIGTFDGFMRGLSFDHKYYYIGQSEFRYFDRLRGQKKHLAMSAGFYLFDDESKAAKFFALPFLRQVHGLHVVR